MTASCLDRLGELARKLIAAEKATVAVGPLVNTDPDKVKATINEWLAAVREYNEMAKTDVVAALVRVAIAVREREAAALAAANATISRVNVPEAHARFHASGKELAKALAALPPDSSEPVDGLDSEARAIARAAKQREDMNREA